MKCYSTSSQPVQVGKFCQVGGQCEIMFRISILVAGCCDDERIIKYKGRSESEACISEVLSCQHNGRYRSCREVYLKMYRNG